jgi:hypothetical protein
VTARGSRPGWRALGDPSSKLGRVFEWKDGWAIYHCGHPTAHRPWYGETGGGLRVVGPTHYLREAQERLELVHAHFVLCTPPFGMHDTREQDEPVCAWCDVLEQHRAYERDLANGLSRRQIRKKHLAEDRRRRGDMPKRGDADALGETR